MRRPTTPCASSLCLSWLLVGCSVFDASLYRSAEGSTSSDESEDDDGTRVGAELFADECILGEVPIISESMSLSLDLGDYRSVGLGYPKCIETQYQGPDTFFMLEAKAGERWNINAAPQNPEQDLAIIVLGDGCTATGCRTVRDRCVEGWDEDFALIAAEDTHYVVSIDSVAPGVGGPVSLTLEKSVCGNGIVEGGETCDGGDNCDALCRREIPRGIAAEGEPNDIFTGVDMIGVPNEGGVVTVTGAVGGPCDEDHYAFIVPRGASVTVRMRAPGGGPCPMDTPRIELPFIDFLAPGGPSVVGVGKITEDQGGCPYFENTGTDPDFEFARNLEPSEYHLIINAFETERRIPYQIDFEILDYTPEVVAGE